LILDFLDLIHPKIRLKKWFKFSKSLVKLCKNVDFKRIIFFTNFSRLKIMKRSMKKEITKESMLKNYMFLRVLQRKRSNDHQTSTWLHPLTPKRYMILPRLQHQSIKHRVSLLPENRLQTSSLMILILPSLKIPR